MAGRHRPKLLIALSAAVSLYVVVIATLAATDAVAAVHGWPGTIVGSIGLLGVLVFIGAGSSRPSRPRTVTAVTGLIVTIASVGSLLIGVVPFKTGAHSEAGGERTISRSPSSSLESDHRGAAGQPSSAKPSPTPRPSATGVATSNEDSCGPTAAQHPPPPVQVCVVYWCKGDVVLPDGEADPRHIQIKVRPQIINNSAHTLSIDIGKPAAVRLLVRSAELPALWGPPPRTKSAGDRPVLVSWNGSELWAVPPNVNHDAAPTPSGFYTGFATSWTATSIAPGSSYFSPLTQRANGQPNQTGDLVFQLPVNSQGEVEIFGLAVITRTAQPIVLAVAPRTQWPQPSQPSSF